jgi:uncharacterized protein (TIGR03067 family)
MRTNYLAGILLITVAGACGDQTQRGGHSSAGASSTSSRSIVGRWALDSFVINGEDWTKGMKARGTVAYYTLNRDGTFRITMGDSVLETGTWSQDTTTSPMIFDHIPNVNGKPGHYVPGIFAITGDTLIVSITGPKSERRHPTQFRSTLADSTWLLVYHRAQQ